MEGRLVVTSYIIGYDPGGKKANGVSYIELSKNGDIVDYNYTTVSTQDEALKWLFGVNNLKISR